MTRASPVCCVIIPVYRHTEPLVSVLRQLEKYKLPCFLVDDGNEVPLNDVLASDLSSWPWVTILRLPANAGKGAACITGARAAQERGFSHALFIDADNQHNTQDIGRVLTLVQEDPQAMILGKPVFDASAPFKRRFGRIFCNLWVWIETWSLDIQDSLCGFRCFPLDRLLQVADSVALSRRMDFDPDIAVRLFWEGLRVVNFETRIRYPEHGISNFHLLRDNASLVRLHTRLFFGMLWRSPFLVTRRWRHAS